jgi:hypothetical protein
VKCISFLPKAIFHLYFIPVSYLFHSYPAIHFIGCQIYFIAVSYLFHSCPGIHFIACPALFHSYFIVAQHLFHCLPSLFHSNFFAAQLPNGELTDLEYLPIKTENVEYLWNMGMHTSCLFCPFNLCNKALLAIYHHNMEISDMLCFRRRMYSIFVSSPSFSMI